MPNTPYSGPYFSSRNDYSDKDPDNYSSQKTALDLIIKTLAQYDEFLILPLEPLATSPKYNKLLKPRFTLVNHFDHNLPSQIPAKVSKKIAKMGNLNFREMSFNASNCAKAVFDSLGRKQVELYGGLRMLERWYEEGTSQNVISTRSFANELGCCYLSWTIDPVLKYAYLINSASEANIRAQGSQYFLYSYLVNETSQFVDHIDFCGADHPSVSKFKEQFANELVTTYQISFQKSSFHFVQRARRWIH